MTAHLSGNTKVQFQTVTSQDSTTISYLTTGAGPALIIIPGALSFAENYALLASALGEVFTVHTIERRGRGLSGPQGNDYSMAKELEDIEALQQTTQAGFLFGHSYGGLIALESARRNRAFTKLAVYDPGVSVDGSISMKWIPAYSRYLAERKYLDAFATFSIGTGPKQGKNMPLWLMKLILPIFLTSQEREEKFQLLAANLLEHGEIARCDSTYQNYREVSAEVLLMFGGKRRPGWLTQGIKALSEVLPSSKVTEFPKLDHFGPDKTAPREIAQAIREYFLGSNNSS